MFVGSCPGRAEGMGEAQNPGLQESVGNDESPVFIRTGRVASKEELNPDASLFTAGFFGLKPLFQPTI